MGELYRNCDLDTVVNFLAKQVSYCPLKKNIKDHMPDPVHFRMFQS